MIGKTQKRDNAGRVAEGAVWQIKEAEQRGGRTRKDWIGRKYRRKRDD